MTSTAGNGAHQWRREQRGGGRGNRGCGHLWACASSQWHLICWPQANHVIDASGLLNRNRRQFTPELSPPLRDHIGSYPTY